jgi:hypothetical protein
MRSAYFINDKKNNANEAFENSEETSRSIRKSNE